MRIIHCLRAPVGGLFRHVADLAREQADMGHQVGIVASKSDSDSLTNARLEALRPVLELGLHRVAMSRQLGPNDITAVFSLANLARRLGAHILHGHGAKGGAYARLAKWLLHYRGSSIQCFYTPHGGSLHFDPASHVGRMYMELERRLLPMTTGIIFESDFSRRVFREKVTEPHCAVRVIPNGVLESEFSPHSPEATATDFLFIGELRELKGVDVLLKALARLQKQEHVTATIVGDGPDAKAFKTLATDLGIASSVIFTGALPAPAAFRRGRILVVPSRAESLPYVVLEAAAGGVPLIATNVGGIPEIVQNTDIPLIPAGDVDALVAELTAARQAPETLRQRAAALRNTIRQRFSASRMALEIDRFYASPT